MSIWAQTSSLGEVCIFPGGGAGATPVYLDTQYSTVVQCHAIATYTMTQGLEEVCIFPGGGAGARYTSIPRYTTQYSTVVQCHAIATYTMTPELESGYTT